MIGFSGNIRFGSAKIIFCLLILAISNACNPTKHLKEGEYLLNNNEVVDRSASLFKLNPDVQKSDFEGYIKQKPNRKVAQLFRFHLFLYNLIDQEKARKKKEKRDARYDRINKERIFKTQVENEKRKKRGKSEINPKLKDKDKLTWREWVMDIGEPPVIYDSSLRVRSTQQLRLFLKNKGYFNNNVKDTVVFSHKKANVYYFITPNKPYKINRVTYDIKDPGIERYVVPDSSNSLMKKGNNYDADMLQRERDRLNKLLRNKGFYYFSKDYIFFQVDSSFRNNTVNINVMIRKRTEKLEDNDSLVERNHIQYFLRYIYIIADYDAKIKRASTDTIPTFSYFILYTGKLKYHTKLLTDAMVIKGFDTCRIDDIELTYKRLLDIHAFKFINIQMVPSGVNTLDCYVQLTPILKQTFTIETEGTNTGGNLGVNGSFVYQNRNAFKGGEILEFRIRAGLEIQKLLTKTTDIGGNILNESPIPFNTIEIGPEANVTIPRFVLPNWVPVSKKSNPKTIFKAGYNYQQRPDYTRSTFQGSYGFNWKRKSTIKHFIFPVEISLVNFTGKEDFEAYLQASQDPLLVYRFTNHLTNDFRYVFYYSNQDIGRKNDFSYFKIAGESSGNGLRGVYNILDQYVQKMPYEAPGYTIGGITFSQYVRSDFDWRYYRNFNLHDRLVFRLAAGVGKPLNNLRELPLEKSFFGGGPSGIRAWKARTLGPGSYSNPNQNSFDKVGDNQVETNLEYRFNVTKIVNGAAFIDAGNVWLRKLDPDRPGGEIKASLETLDEFAIGAGLGLRLDFSFFVIRFDAAVPIKDPAYKKGDRWTFDHQPFMRTNLNFGIGYPF